jgi:hypothetical protein
VSFGTAHPAAYHCKNLTTGGYNTWYLPAKGECTTIFANTATTPFAIANGVVGDYYWSSTEYGGGRAAGGLPGSSFDGQRVKSNPGYVRAVRRL